MRLFRERAFPLLAGILWVIFLFLDITNRADSTWVKFAGICLCCVTALLGAKTPDAKLVAAALSLTVAADVFLLVLNRSYMDRVIGVALFIPVQLLYAYRLYLQRGRWITFYTPERFIGLVAAVVWLAFGLDLLTALVIIYFTSLTANVAEGLGFRIGIALDITLHPLRNRFCWGLFLFFCCDVCVGFWNLGFFPGFTRVGMWLFYLPSQVLIVLSQEQGKGYPDEKTV